MTLRAYIALILLSGLVCADVTTPPADITTTGSPETPDGTSTTKAATTTATNTTQLSTTSSTTESPTTTHNSTTTQAPTTTHNGTTTEAPTTTHNSTTTEAPTTTHNGTTTEAPTTTHNGTTTEAPTTTHHNATNATTEAPTTQHANVTTAPTPPPTTPPVPNPTVGNYSVRPDVNSTACLLAKMGLQFSIRTAVNSSFQTFNLDPSPNVTAVSGSCGSGGSDSSLVLKSEKITVQFVFTNVSEKFRLHSLMLSIDIGGGSLFNDSNTNLSLWEATVGSSYMCKKEQSYNISDKLTLNTFELQVQPFAVQKNGFSTAHECSMDDTSLLIPIIVGAALAGLIFIVVIAYVIGRRRTYVGYQTLSIKSSRLVAAEECFLDSDLSFLVPIAVGVALSFLIILVLISYLIGRRKSRTGYQSV